MMTRLVKRTEQASRVFNVVSCVAVVLMMTLTTADVILRLFGSPIPGTYEMVGFLGIAVVSFALAYTSVEKGHIAVELLVERLPQRAQIAVEGISALIGAGLFSLIAWQSLIYAADMQGSGEVSMTLSMPVYPFIYGMAAGFGLLIVVQAVEFARSARRLIHR